MTYCSNIRRIIGLALFLLMGLTPLIPQVYGVSAPMVSSLTSIKDGVRTPVRLAVDQWGFIYVTDPRGGGVNIFNNAGKKVSSFPVASMPLGVAVATNGDLLVSQGTAVKALDKTSGTVKSVFGAFKKANAITVDGSGIIYVTDSLDNCVQVFNADYSAHTTGAAASGKPANSFGTNGQANGQFLQPTGISYEKSANQLAVVDSLNGRIQFFNTDGVWQKTIGSQGAGPLKFSLPQSVAFEYSTDTQALVRIYVMDTYQANVQVLDATTTVPTFLRYIGSYGMKQGELVVPSDLILDNSDTADSRLIIANGSGSLALFGISGWNSGNTGSSPTAPTLTINSYPLATNLTTLTLSGSIISADSVKVNGVNAAISGSTWTVPVALHVGSNVITVQAANATGTLTRSITVTVIAQTGTPVVLTVDSFQSPTKISTLTLKGSVTDGASSVMVNNQSATVVGTAWSKTVTLVPGLNNFMIVGSKDGYSDGKTSLNITLDNTAPDLDPKKAFMLSDGATTQQPVQTLTGTVFDESPTTVTVQVNGVMQAQVPVNDGVYSLPVTLALGKNTVVVTATDVAGNVSKPVQRTITYDPQAAPLVVNVPNNAVLMGGSSQYSFTFSAPAGVKPSVTVNGMPVDVTGAQAAAPSTDMIWTATTSNFVAGLNLLEITGTDPLDPAKKSVIAKILTYSTGAPSVAVTVPAQDMTTAKSAVYLAGKATPGASIYALVNGEVVPVTVSANGDFYFTVTFSDVGNYAIVVSATDSNGNTSYSYRSLIYDKSVPAITFNKSTKKYTATNGILYAKDKDGNFVSDGVNGSGTAALDVSNYTGSSPLNVFALGAGGASSRNGDLSAVKKGYVDITDALKALQFAVGTLQPTDEDLLYGDVATTNGKPVLDGKIHLDDVINILHKAVDLAD
jgi:uncharacterized Zn-binding protein involved in type VI secretion